MITKMRFRKKGMLMAITLVAMVVGTGTFYGFEKTWGMVCYKVVTCQISATGCGPMDMTIIRK